MTLDPVFEHDHGLALIERFLMDALYHAALPSHNAASPQTAMSAALGEACRLAHQRRLRPEQMIIMLKGAWTRVNGSSFASRGEAQDALARAVTACIEQYFADRDGCVVNPSLPPS